MQNEVTITISTPSKVSTKWMEAQILNALKLGVSATNIKLQLGFACDDKTTETVWNNFRVVRNRTAFRYLTNERNQAPQSV